MELFGLYLIFHVVCSILVALFIGYVYSVFGEFASLDVRCFFLWTGFMCGLHCNGGRDVCLVTVGDLLFLFLAIQLGFCF